MSTIFHRGIRAASVAAALLLPVAAISQPVATVRDAVEMVRIQYNASKDTVAAISGDGRQAAYVTWHGDIARNVNVYELNLLPLEASGKSQVVATRTFIGDPLDQVASAFSDVRFTADGKSLAFLGRDEKGLSQAFVTSIAQHVTRQLTRHSTHVRAFALDQSGALTAFSAISYPQDEVGRRLTEDGLFTWDADLFPRRFPFVAALPVLLRQDGRDAAREYFTMDDRGTERRFFDSTLARMHLKLDINDPEVASSPSISYVEDTVLQVMGAFVGDATGRRVLMFPYARATDDSLQPETYAYIREMSNPYMRKMAASIGIVDTKTGKIEPLLNAPSPYAPYESGTPLWSPDGRSVIAYTLFPDDRNAPPQWVEVDVATRRITRLGLQKEWMPTAWTDGGRSLLIVHRGREFGTLTRTSSGWASPAVHAPVAGLNGDWSVATNGRVLLGVKDGLDTPPELVQVDAKSGAVRTLTDLNPHLRTLRLGKVIPQYWQEPRGADANGFLIEPVGYQAGTRYPLVILLDDGTLHRAGEPYLFDGVWQLAGHAAQMLAGEGFMVLYTREPRHLGDAPPGEEGVRIQAFIEAAVAKLDRGGLIDPKRIGISGWSRAGYHTDYLQIHSSIRFAAASSIDGGGAEYLDRMRPYTDAELQSISSPKLIEAHGLPSFVLLAPVVDRMLALGRPADILYFETASHSTTRPQHRVRSLETHIDWWRFWLQGKEDPAPEKAAQFARWRELKAMRDLAADRTGRRPAIGASAP